MKPLLSFSLLVTLYWVSTQVVYAQQTGSISLQRPFSKGCWQLGVKDGYGGSPLIGYRNTAQLQAGYYVANRLLVGIGGSYGWDFSGNDSGNGLFATNNLSVTNNGIIAVGPLVRYQVIAGRLSPYTELAYQYGSRGSRVEKTLSFTPGVSAGLFAGLRLDLSYNFQLINNGAYGQPQAGISYLFHSN